jgi:putative thiamine transport system permease protein
LNPRGFNDTAQVEPTAMIRRLCAIPLALLLVFPLGASVLLLLPDVLNTQAFADLVAHPQFAGSLKITIFTGVTSTLISLLLAIVIITSAHNRLQTDTGFMLAVPHVALTIGLVFLIAPTGAIARIIGTLDGWTTPPQWITTQDPLGWSLIAALVLKETPFLVWALAALLNRDDLKLLLRGHQRVARALGHGGLSIWLSVLLPQLLPRITWPLVAVFSYSCTVVDMAMITGPTQPPTLASLIWTDINDGDPVHNSRGAAGVLILTSVIIVLLMMSKVFHYCVGRATRIFLLQHAPSQSFPPWLGSLVWRLLIIIYGIAILFLLLASVSGQWPFPALAPAAFTFKGWSQLIASATPASNSLALAVVTTLAGTGAAIAWLETQSRSRDWLILSAAAITLCLPSLLIGLGQYRLFLQLGITGTATAMFLAHALPVAAYVFIMVSGPYRAYDSRWQSVSNGLLKTRADFLRRIKWPMLKAPIISSAAVGFAVSFAQFVPAQLASAGRYTTLPIEAVTLTSGGNRALIAVYALALMGLPLLAFLTASWIAKPRHA